MPCPNTKHISSAVVLARHSNAKGEALKAQIQKDCTKNNTKNISSAVVLACRSNAKGEALKAAIQKDCAKKGLPTPELEIRQLDLASLE
jgi:hypothetical protein